MALALESQSLSFPATVFIQFCFAHSFKVCLEKRKPKQKASLTSGDSASWHPQLTHLKELTQPLAVPGSSQKLRQASVPARGPSAKAYSHGESIWDRGRWARFLLTFLHSLIGSSRGKIVTIWAIVAQRSLLGGTRSLRARPRRVSWWVNWNVMAVGGWSFRWGWAMGTGPVTSASNLVTPDTGARWDCKPVVLNLWVEGWDPIGVKWPFQRGCI